MKICFVCNEYPPGLHGGIGSFTQTLARALVERGHSVRVIGVYKPGRPCENREVDHGVEIWRMQEIQIPKIGWIIDRIRLYRLIKDWSSRGDIEIVEVPDYQGLAAYWGKLSAPVSARLHGSSAVIKLERNQKKKIAYLLEKASLLRADIHVGISSFILNSTQNIFVTKFDEQIVIYDSVYVPQHTRMDLDERKKNMVVFAGTLNENKGIPNLIDAWKLVTKEMPEAELHLYGKDGLTHDGQSMTDFVLHQTKLHNLANVFLHGHVSKEQIYQVFSHARLAVFPSFVEALSLVAIEAMACGCSTVFTNCASGPEIICHGEDGLLVDPNSPDEIAMQILRVLKDDSLAIRLGAKARQKALNNFSAEKLTILNEEYFQGAIRRFSS